MTDDEKRIADIEGRAAVHNGSVTLSEDDYRSLLVSRLAWKFTAKCFSSRKPSESPRWLRDEQTGQFFERQTDGVYAPLSEVQQ